MQQEKMIQLELFTWQQKLVISAVLQNEFRLEMTPTRKQLRAAASCISHIKEEMLRKLVLSIFYDVRSIFLVFYALIVLSDNNRTRKNLRKKIDEVSKLLIDNGADIKSANDKGWEPAHIIYQNPRLSDDVKLDLISKLTDLNADIPKSLPWYTINIMGYKIPILPPPQHLTPRLKDAIQSLGVSEGPASLDVNEVQSNVDIEKDTNDREIQNLENSAKITKMSENLENTLRKNFELGNQISSLSKEKIALNVEKEQLGEKIVGLSKEKIDLEVSLKQSRTELEAQKEESKTKMNEMEVKMRSEIDSLKNQIRQELKNKVDASIQTDKVSLFIGLETTL